MNMRLPARLFKRKADSHKGDYGRVLILAGSRAYAGAPCLCAESALRAGAGLVTLGVPEGLYNVIASKVIPEVIVLPLPDAGKSVFCRSAVKNAAQSSKKADCVLLGPGLSVDRQAQEFVFSLIGLLDTPLVIDADGINSLALRPGLLKTSENEIVLTPHPGEMAALCKCSSAEVQRNRKKVAKDFATRYNVTLVLKGNDTVVVSGRGDCYVNSTGNPGMATAGSGDCLAGILAAFIGQGIAPYDAARMAVYIHGLAGDLAARDKTQVSLIASDIIDYLPKAFILAQK